MRFLYVRPLAGYLALDPPAAVIETAIDDGLDLCGWDVRKALGLIVRSNAVVLEWLHSPVTYRQDAPACTALRELARHAAHLPALAYHYDRMARRFWTPDGVIPLKSLFYAVRPALALALLSARNEPPPMDLPTLLAGLQLPHGLAAAIEAVRNTKLAGTESDDASCPTDISLFLSAVLATPVVKPEPWDSSAAMTDANHLFRGFLS